MKEISILEEVWRIKDQLAREAGYDLHQLCENTRHWAQTHPHNGPIVHNADERKRWMDRAKQGPTNSLTLNDAPPSKKQ